MDSSPDRTAVPGIRWAMEGSGSISGCMGWQVGASVWGSPAADELSIHLAPVLLGAGVRLFDQVGPALALEGIEVIESRLVTHLKYQVGK